jgi:hypothetical protein
MRIVLAIVKRGLARFLLQVSLLALMLAGCSQPLKTSPNLPEDFVKALVHGPVQSVFLEPLNDSFEMTVYDGSQDLEDFDLILLDGHHHAPAELRDDALVQKALGTGMWVLLVDATAEHKKDGLGDALLFASDKSSAYAAHVGQDPHGRPWVQIVDYPTTAEVGTAPGATISSAFQAQSSDSQGLDVYAASAFADALLDRITTPTQPEVRALADTPIPPDLVYAQISYTVPVSWTIQGNAADFNKQRAANRLQRPNFTADYTFTVFLNNHDDPHGDYQRVLVDASVQASPKARNEDFLAARVKSSADWTVDWEEWGWFQTHWRHSISTGALAVPNALLRLLQTSPETENGETELTTGVEFSIGFKGSKPDGDFTYSSETTRNIKDWKVTNESANNVATWYYRTQYPLDNDVEGTCMDGRPCKADWTFGTEYCGQEIYRMCYIRMDPNDLSIDTLSLTTLAAYRTENPDGSPKLVDGWADFTVSSEHGMIDLFCYDDFGFGCAVPLDNEAKYQSQNTYHIDLGAVIPLPVTSLTFSPDPVAGGTNVTGTVTLSEPARFHTTVLLSSNMEVNAPVPSEVVFKPGESSKAFSVVTTPNGIPAGERVDAVITAYNALYPAVQVQSRLTITR